MKYFPFYSLCKGNNIKILTKVYTLGCLSQPFVYKGKIVNNLNSQGHGQVNYASFKRWNIMQSLIINKNDFIVL